MHRVTRFSIVLSFLAFPALASAQILMVEVEAPPPLQQAPIVVEQPAEEPREMDVDAAVGLGIWVEMMSLDSMQLTLSDPEIRALAGIDLSDWQGQGALAQPVITGAMISVGMRADDWLRGPELRFSLGGADITGEPALAPGGSELELWVEQAIVLRTELALGVQAPLGDFRPYLVGRIGIGGAFVDIAARDARLGNLGTETAEQLIADVGVEAGIAFHIDDGIEFGGAFRAGINHHGDDSIGGMMTMTVVEND